MKRTMIIGAVIAALLAGGAQAAEVKIGVVSLQKCFEDYYKTKQADSTLKDAGDAYIKERQGLIAEFQKLQEERNKLLEEINKPELSAAAKSEKQKEAEAKLAELQKQKQQIDEFDRLRRDSLANQQNRMRGNIVKEISDKVSQVAKAQNFTIILDTSGLSANGTPVVAFVEDRLDITLDVLRELNRNAPSSAPAQPKATEAPKPTPAPTSAPAPAK